MTCGTNQFKIRAHLFNSNPLTSLFSSSLQPPSIPPSPTSSSTSRLLPSHPLQIHLPPPSPLTPAPNPLCIPPLPLPPQIDHLPPPPPIPLPRTPPSYQPLPLPPTQTRQHHLPLPLQIHHLPPLLRSLHSHTLHLDFLPSDPFVLNHSITSYSNKSDLPSALNLFSQYLPIIEVINWSASLSLSLVFLLASVKPERPLSLSLSLCFVFLPASTKLSASLSRLPSCVSEAQRLPLSRFPLCVSEAQRLPLSLIHFSSFFSVEATQ